MKHHTQTLHRRLTELQGLKQQTRAVEERILQFAADRLDVVNADIDKLLNRSLINETASDRYKKLILERGRLHQVIANSRRHLS